jgi:hypothetical protein
MKFFALDLHIGIRDIQHVFEQLGHSLDVWSISDHHHVMGWPRAAVDVVNQYSWMGLNKEMCDAFYERYKGELADYDGFVCFYPPAFSMLYEKFQKPIIVQVPLRYETPFFNDKFRWSSFNSYIQRGIDSGQIIPLVNNEYDKAYVEKFTGRSWTLLPSLCNYTGADYTGKRSEFLYFSKAVGLENLIKLPNLVNKSTVRGYSWQDIADYKALIYVPYSNTLMSLFEQYSANIPMFFPSQDFLVFLWKNFRGVMSELSFRQIFGLSPGTIIGSSSPDPNDYRDEKSFISWAKSSDFYSLPHVQLYDGFGDLEDKLGTVDFFNIHAKMYEYNQTRTREIIGLWQTVLNRICS